MKKKKTTHKRIAIRKEFSKPFGRNVYVIYKNGRALEFRLSKRGALSLAKKLRKK